MAKTHLPKTSSKQLWAYMGAVGFVVLFALVGFHLISSSFAATSNDAAFSITPSSGSYTVGDTLVVIASETSGVNDTTNAIQANLTYPASQLQFKSLTVNGPFKLCSQKTAGGGSINLGCASTTPSGGNQPIVQIIFTIIAANPTVTVAMGPGSNITNTDGSSLWNGSLPSATYSFSAAPKTTGGNHQQPVHVSPSLPVVVTDSHNRPVRGAKVSLDGRYTQYTNGQGSARFTHVSVGSHKISVTAQGKQPSLTHVTVAASQNAPVVFQLTSTPLATLLPILIYGAAAVVLASLGYWYIFVHRRPPRVTGGSGGVEVVTMGPAGKSPAKKSRSSKRNSIGDA